MFLFLLLLLSGCSGELDPSKDWRISKKTIYTEYVSQLGLSSYKVTDGTNSEIFDDSTYKYHVGDTIGHHKFIPEPTVDSSRRDSLKLLK